MTHPTSLYEKKSEKENAVNLNGGKVGSTQNTSIWWHISCGNIRQQGTTELLQECKLEILIVSGR